MLKIDSSGPALQFKKSSEGRHGVCGSVSQSVFGKEKKSIYNLFAYAIVDPGVRMCDMCMLPAPTGEEYQFAAPRVWYEVPTLW